MVKVWLKSKPLIKVTRDILIQHLIWQPKPRYLSAQETTPLQTLSKFSLAFSITSKPSRPTWPDAFFLSAFSHCRSEFTPITSSQPYFRKKKVYILKSMQEKLWSFTVYCAWKWSLSKIDAVRGLTWMTSWTTQRTIDSASGQLHTYL